MDESRRKGILIAAVIWVVILGGLAIAYKQLIHPYFVEGLIDATGSDSQYAHTIKVAADAFSGYAVLRSAAMKNELKAQGIEFYVQDDKADYIARIKSLKQGKTDMAVFTVDAYLTAGAIIGDFPATIVMVIDETVGADAIVAYKSGVATMQDLDSAESRIVATPSSPSEFLARTMIATLSLPSLPETWLIEADGAGDVYKRFKAASTPEKKYAYVLWEPYVSKALKEADAHVLLDSSKMKGYIVDVLVARRAFLTDHPELVRKTVEAYLRAAHSYDQQPNGMINLVMEDAEAGGEALTKDEARQLIRGIQWKNTLENYAHLALIPSTTSAAQGLEDIINKIGDVLVRSSAIDNNPLLGKAHTIFFKGTLAELQSNDFHPGKKLNILQGVGPGQEDLAEVRAATELPTLSQEQWSKLQRVGAMRVEPIAFRRGTAEISEFSQSELNALAGRFKSMPMYYMRIVGHARPEGDADANLELARQRARAARKYLLSRGVAAQRLRALGAKPSANGGASRAEVSFTLGQNPY